MTLGACATGHPATTAAAAEILEDGGSAVDAAIAAAATACVAEPVLASLGGGGVALVTPSGGPPALVDFFPQTPSRSRRIADIDIRGIDADFRDSTQPFYMGLGTAAVPGMARGLFALHTAYGRLPMRRLMEPAVRAARDGVIVTDQQAEICRIVRTILLATPDSRHVFTGAPDGTDLPAPGAAFRWPALAELLDVLAHEDDRLLYEGELGRAIADQSADAGGWITADDMAGYRAERRTPERDDYRGWTVLTNPAPAVGGDLLLLTLALLETRSPRDWAAGTPDTVLHVGRALAAVGDVAEGTADDIRAARGPDRLETLRQRLRGRPAMVTRGTTQISVADRTGTAIALTLSNGEGCGVIAPGGAFMLNNILGEPDLCRDGPEAWPPRTRLPTMMAPTVAGTADGRLLVCGSGGSRRIRSAIPQVISHVLDDAWPLDMAVEAPRLHWEDGELHVEADDGGLLIDCAQKLSPNPQVWTGRSLFFGGVNAVLIAGDNAVAASDSRRGGTAWVR